ncbi:MAG TPA: TlpA disulfide reductase family protein [Candidatus Eremiobacteraceae bacterium]|jgi:thiol-disulfide isomerase/thioredoxin|nr:TlpA disulfide reductase family protein [Candidatus Eremiobacteraceae bacterium]
MQSRRAPLLLIIFLIVLAAFLYHHRYGVMSRVRALMNIKPPSNTRTVLEAGQRLPAVQLTNLGGQQLVLAPQPGHVLYLNVFTTWCPECQKETPALEELRKKTAGMPVDIIGVDQEEDIAPISDFVQRYGLTYPIFIDSSGVTHTAMGVRYIPTSFIVDSHGVVRARITGAITLAQMEQAVNMVLRGGRIAVQ